MAGDDEVPVGGRTMQVDAVADALDVLDGEAGSIPPPSLPPGLPPPLPPKRSKFPLVAALVAAGVAVGAAVLVSKLLEPDAPVAPPAAAAEPVDADEADEADEPFTGTHIDLGPILVEATHDGGAVDESDDAPADPGDDVNAP